MRYNKVFGYYIEVTNSYKDLVPDYYIRRQTLANAERYTTEELSELARTILGAEDRLYALEYETYVAIREKLAAEMERIQKTASVIAWTDVFASLALVAETNQYVRPTLNQRGVIDIKDGRHPVVEKMMSGELFVANDTLLDHKKESCGYYYRTEYGRKVYLYETDCAYRTDGTDWFFCSGKVC